VTFSAGLCVTRPRLNVWDPLFWEFYDEHFTLNVFNFWHRQMQDALRCFTTGNKGMNAIWREKLMVRVDLHSQVYSFLPLLIPYFQLHSMLRGPPTVLSRKCLHLLSSPNIFRRRVNCGNAIRQPYNNETSVTTNCLIRILEFMLVRKLRNTRLYPPKRQKHMYNSMHYINNLAWKFPVWWPGNKNSPP